VSEAVADREQAGEWQNDEQPAQQQNLWSGSRKRNDENGGERTKAGWWRQWRIEKQASGRCIDREALIELENRHHMISFYPRHSFPSQARMTSVCDNTRRCTNREVFLDLIGDTHFGGGLLASVL
jgi:hypothetical protein